MKLKTFTLAALAALCAAGAQAQKITPGLWEYSVTMKSQGGQMEAAMAKMQEDMARMPPEKRKQMEAMLGQNGMAMAAGKPMLVKACITPEQAARDEMPQQDGQCKQTQKERSGNTLKFKFECAGERPMTGTGEFTMTSDKAYSGRLVMEGSTKGGKAEKVDMQQTGRWLGADCGDVKSRGKP